MKAVFGITPRTAFLYHERKYSQENEGNANFGDAIYEPKKNSK
jgi:hypothetical protein